MSLSVLSLPTQGLYSKFADKATYELYKDDADHRELVRTLIVPNTEDIMSYDIEY